MWKLIGLIFEALEDETIEKALIKAIEKNSPALHKAIKGVQKIDNNIQKTKQLLRKISPQNLVNHIANLPKTFTSNILQRKINNLNSKVKNKMSDAKYVNDLKKVVDNDTKEAKKTADEQWKDLINGKSGNWIDLSSSWLKKGWYVPGSNGLGSLTVIIKSDYYPKVYGPYTYPMISSVLWADMRAAKGKNGSGAGQVFWDKFLHGWIGSTLREFAYKKLAQTSTNKDVKDYLEDKIKRIKSLNGTFYRKNAKREIKNFNDTISFKFEQLNIVKNQKQKIYDNYQSLKKEASFFREQRDILKNQAKEMRSSLNKMRETKKITMETFELMKHPIKQNPFSKQIRKDRAQFKKQSKAKFKSFIQGIKKR